MAKPVHGTQRFLHPHDDDALIGDALPGRIYNIQTTLMDLTVAEVRPPFNCSERGRDRFGLYADVRFVLSDGPAITQRMRYIEPGQFLMGSPESEVESSKDEHPQHPVTISHGLWLADTACTQALWQAVMGSNPSHFNAKNRGRSEHPVENVSWAMVQEFLTKLETVLIGLSHTPTRCSDS